MTTKNYVLTYWEIDHNCGIQHTAMLDSFSDLEAIIDAKRFIESKAEYMDVVEDSFIIEDDEHTIAQFDYGKLLRRKD